MSKIDKAIERVYDKISKMTKEEFLLEVEKMKQNPNSLYWTLAYARDPVKTQKEYIERFGKRECN